MSRCWRCADHLTDRAVPVTLTVGDVGPVQVHYGCVADALCLLHPKGGEYEGLDLGALEADLIAGMEDY